MTKLNLTPYFIIVILALVIFSGIAVTRCSTNKATGDRQTENVQSKGDSIQKLNLTIDEFKNLQFRDKDKIDSLMVSNDTKARLIDRISISKTKYKDTTKTSANVGAPVVVAPVVSNKDTLKPKEPILYSLSVESSNNCWGMVGEMITTDPKAKFNVLQRSFQTIQSAIYKRQKRFLGFLWITQRRKVIANTSCGQTEITDVTISR
jgi:hypothetical protein